MSIKTLRKRIALVATFALGASLVAVAPSSALNGATGMVTDTLYLSTVRDIDGTANGAAVGAGLTNAMTSVGWSADTSATTQTTSGASTGSFVYANSGQIRTANVFPSAQIAFAAKGSSTAGDGLTVTVTGGTLSQLVATQATGAGAAITIGSQMINAGSTTITVTDSLQEIIQGVVNVNAAVGSTATISVYSGSGITSLATATAGTLQARYVFTVISASVSGVYNAAESTVTQQTCITAAETPGSNAYDTTSRCRNAYVGIVYVDLEDAFGAAITSGYTFTASASAGNVIISDTAAAATTANGATSGFSSDTADSDGSYWVYVTQPTANTAGTSVVTLALDGQTIGTKTITWQGDIATLEIDEANSCAYFSTNQGDVDTNVGAGCVVYVAKDAAGNVLTLGSQPSVADATGALIGSTTSATTVAGFAALQTASTGYGYTMLVVPANTLSGAATYQLKLTNAVGATIKSKYAKVTVSRGSTNSFSISWDKATYNPGDIATLTITAKDLYGNLMADGTALAGLSLTVNTGGFASVGTACSTSSTFLNGVKTCKYAVLNDEGSYAYSVDITTVTPQSASVGTLPIVAKTAAVSNAEVLAAIVKLIASINTQIAALQKMIAKSNKKK